MKTKTVSPNTPGLSRTIANPIMKDEVTFLETSRESGGRHTLVEVKLAHGGGVDLHYHNDFAEEFTCLEGEVSIQVGKTITRLRPGETATALARNKHRFFNHSTSLRSGRFIQPGRLYQAECRKRG